MLHSPSAPVLRGLARGIGDATRCHRVLRCYSPSEDPPGIPHLRKPPSLAVKKILDKDIPNVV